MENDYSGIMRQLLKFKNVQGLMRYVNVPNLMEIHRKQPRDKATGVDRKTKEEYGKDLENNLNKLINNMKSYKYYPNPVKRTNISKENGKLRPLGIPSYEDRLVQANMAEILKVIWEPIFLDCSYGFRPNRDCHKAIKQLDEYIMRGKTNYIVEADIKGFFDHVDHKWLIEFLEHVIKDSDFIFYIRRFLRAGYMEKGQYFDTEEGTPQGGLISPILANVYLHFVLDLWFERIIKEECTGECHLIRFADDFVCTFEKEEEAKMFYEKLKKRLLKFNLEIAEDKTRIFPFGRNSKGKKEFDFLGFTIYNSKTMSGYYKCGYRTSSKKSKVKFQNIKEYIKQNRNMKPDKLIKAINKKLTGLYNYYGISFNLPWLRKLYNFVKYQMKYWLSRRSQRGKVTWEKMEEILKYNPLVQPRITFSLW